MSAENRGVKKIPAEVTLSVRESLALKPITSERRTAHFATGDRSYFVKTRENFGGMDRRSRELYTLPEWLHEIAILHHWEERGVIGVPQFIGADFESSPWTMVTTEVSGQALSSSQVDQEDILDSKELQLHINTAIEAVVDRVDEIHTVGETLFPDMHGGNILFHAQTRMASIVDGAGARLTEDLYDPEKKKHIEDFYHLRFVDNRITPLLNALTEGEVDLLKQKNGNFARDYAYLLDFKLAVFAVLNHMLGTDFAQDVRKDKAHERINEFLAQNSQIQINPQLMTFIKGILSQKENEKADGMIAYFDYKRKKRRS